MSFREYSRTEEYQRKGTNDSKAYMGVFIAVCLFVLIFRDWSLGWRWLIALPIGLFASSIIGGLFSIAGYYADYRRILIVGSLLPLIGFFAVMFGSYYSLRFAASL